MIHELKTYFASPQNYVGTDLVMKAVKYCREHFPEFEFHKNEPTTLPHLNRTFDMICLFSVFTHMYPNEIRELLIDAKKLLKEKGSIIASVSINQFVSSYIGTRDKIEMNEKQFFDIARSAGFSKINRYPTREIGQHTVYEIQL